MSDTSSRERWEEDRTTFQRVYDVLVGTQTFLTAQEYAERANCSATAARSALENLVEMGIANRQQGRPVQYRRNESYLRWKRVESLAREHSPEELQERLDELVAEDDSFQEKYGVPDPDAVSPANLPVDDHDAIHERWDDLSEWRTIRRDIRVVRRAVDRAQRGVDDGVHA